MSSNRLKFKNVYDISVLLGVESVDFPGDTQFSRDFMLKIAEFGVNVSKLKLSAHAGTHVDAPLHFIPEGKSIDEYPVQQFILPAHVVDIKDKESIQPAELENLDIKQGDALLFKTDNSKSGRSTSGVYSEDFVYLSPEAADFCAEEKISLVGIDYGTIDRHGDMAAPSHHKILGSNILILEGINLKEVPSGQYTLFCLPLKIKGSEASPARAILIS